MKAKVKYNILTTIAKVNLMILLFLGDALMNMI